MRGEPPIQRPSKRFCHAECVNEPPFDDFDFDFLFGYERLLLACEEWVTIMQAIQESP